MSSLYAALRPLVLSTVFAVLAAGSGLEHAKAQSVVSAPSPRLETASRPAMSSIKPESTRKRTDLRLNMDKFNQFIVYIGTYTTGKSKGIYIFQMDAASGTLTPAGNGPETSNPSFLTIAPNHKFLYAANEISDYNGTHEGAVSAFAITPTTGALTLLNQQPSRGAGPCFVSIDSKSKNVLVANYGSGSVACLPVGTDGKLGAATAFVEHTGMGPNAARQDGPHAHSINLDQANHYAFAADLGLDKLFIYHFDPAKGMLTPNKTPFVTLSPGSGPRHFAFHPNGHYAYLINEMKSTVTAFDYDKQQGALKEVQTVTTLPEGFTGENTTAEVQVHPSGKFLYGSNRGHNSIVIYAIDAASGKLTLVGHEPTQGKTPRNFGIDPTGTYLLAANQDTDNVVVFRIDAQTGKLTPTGQTLDIPSPVCVKFLPLAP